jgi:tetratricopeptide (TPR) repeat protein
LAENGRELETAQGLAEGVRRREPQNAAAADTLGWIYYKKDLLGLAKAQAEFAVSRQSNNSVFQYHLGQIYRKCGNTPKAVAAFRKAASGAGATKEKDLAQEDAKALLSKQEQVDAKDRASCGA